jgi:hypothetical protein
VSQQSDGSGGFAELDAGPDGDRRSSLQRAMQGMGLGRATSRRNSQGTARRNSSGATVRQEMEAEPRTGNRLEDVAETDHDRSGTAGGDEAGQAPPMVEKQQIQENSALQMLHNPALEVELERREGQKIMGLGRDLLHNP